MPYCVKGDCPLKDGKYRVLSIQFNKFQKLQEAIPQHTSLHYFMSFLSPQLYREISSGLIRLFSNSLLTVKTGVMLVSIAKVLVEISLRSPPKLNTNLSLKFCWV